MSQTFYPDAASRAEFAAEKMGKTTLYAGAQMMVGLNAFEPGQEHALHEHSGMDKLYCVLEGSAEVTIGEETQSLAPGGLAVAPADVPHAVRNSGADKLVVMVAMAPPPGQKGQSG